MTDCEIWTVFFSQNHRMWCLFLWQSRCVCSHTPLWAVYAEKTYIDFQTGPQSECFTAADVTERHEWGEKRGAAAGLEAYLQRIFTVRSPRLFGGGGDCFCSEQAAGADLSTEPKLSRVIVSFLLNRIRAQRCGGFSPPVNPAAGGRQRLPAGQVARVNGPLWGPERERERGLQVHL